MHPWIEDVASDRAQDELVSLGFPSSSDFFDHANTRAADYAKERSADLVTQIDESTRNMLRSKIAAGLASGAMRDDIIADVMDGDIFDEKRAALIADTEVGMANGQGALAGYKEARAAGVKLKKTWVTDDDPCFPAGAMIATADGPKPIEDIASGELVYTREGLKSVTGLSARPYCGRMVVLCTENDDVLALTANHPVFVQGDWVEAGCIEVGDCLQLLCNKVAKVATVVHIDLIDAHDRPVIVCEEAVAWRVTSFVMVPVLAIDLDRDSEGFECKVDHVSAKLKFSGERHTQIFETDANRLFNGRLPIRRAIASEAAVFPIFFGRSPTKASAAAGASSKNGGLITFFRAVSRQATLLVGRAWRSFWSEFLTTSFAGNFVLLDHVDARAFPRAVFFRGGRPAEELGAATDASHVFSFGVGNGITRSGTELSGPIKALRSNELLAAVVAVIGERHTKTLDFVGDLEHGRFVMVYNLSVNIPEYYANGILVHNCDVCEENADAGPIDVDSEFPSGDDAETAHPGCKCHTESVVEEDETDDDDD